MNWIKLLQSQCFAKAQFVVVITTILFALQEYVETLDV